MPVHPAHSSIVQFGARENLGVVSQRLLHDAGNPSRIASNSLPHRNCWNRCKTAVGSRRFLCNDNLIPFVVCKPSAWKLLNFVNAVIETTPEKPLSMEKKLDFMEAWHITNSLTEFETVFSAELQTLASYFVSQKLIYSTTDLIERPENLFPENIRQALPRQCVDDIKQAGKCIAFDIPTAAAFHILRATESVIRLYYTHVVGHPPKSQMRNWGAYVKNLAAAGADTKITGFLDHIREQYRNPIFHPDEMLTSDDSVILLGTAVSAICLLYTSRCV